MLCYEFLNFIVIYILKTYKEESLFSESEPKDKNRTTHGDDGDGGKEDNSKDGCNKDDKGKEDKDKWLDVGTTIMTKIDN